MLPNFLGIGAPKAATTWLFHCLRDHPEIFVADSKEVTFFDYDHIEGRLSTYEKHFSRAGDAKAVGEFSTRYLASSSAPARVKSLIPDARLIVSLRRPADQVYSHYWHLRRQNFHSTDRNAKAPSFEAALSKMQGRLLAPAFYFRNLNNWLSHFDRERIHIILFEDIENDPNRTVEDLYAFLGVDPGFVPATLCPNRFQTRKGKVAGSEFKENLHRHIYTLLEQYAYTPLKSVIGVRRADKIKSLLKIREAMDILFHDTEYPCMSAETRRLVARQFDSDVRELQNILERPLTSWLSDSLPD